MSTGTFSSFSFVALIIFLNLVWLSWWKRSLYFLCWRSWVHQMLWISCKLQVLYENASPVGLLALRKDLSRYHKLHCRTHLNNHLPPRSHNAENEIFSLYFTRHQRCSTDITRQHFFVFLSGAHQAVPSVPACWTGPREVPSRAMRPQSERWGWMERRFQAEWRKARWEKQDQKMMSRKRTYAGKKKKKKRTVMSYISLCSLCLTWCDFHCSVSGNSTNGRT